MSRRRQKVGQAKTAIRSSYSQATICRFIKGEETQDRHRRRYEMAAECAKTVEAWCEYRGVGFRLTDCDGRPAFKWRFSFPDRFAIWMPWTGKFSCKQSLRGEYHVVKVYDYEQLLKALEWWLGENLV